MFQLNHVPKYGWTTNMLKPPPVYIYIWMLNTYSYVDWLLHTKMTPADDSLRPPFAPRGWRSQEKKLGSKKSLLISASPDIPLRSKQLGVNAGCLWHVCFPSEFVCLLQWCSIHPEVAAEMKGEAISPFTAWPVQGPQWIALVLGVMLRPAYSQLQVGWSVATCA